MLKNFIKTKFAILLFVAKFLGKTKKTANVPEKVSKSCRSRAKFYAKISRFFGVSQLQKIKKTLFKFYQEKFPGRDRY